MELIPHDELKSAHGFNFAPMIDFLFLMLSLFATLAITRATLHDTEVDLVQLKPDGPKQRTSDYSKEQLHISILPNGTYKWLTEFQEISMDGVSAIRQELIHQYETGALPEDKSRTEVLMHIDKQAPWESIASAIFAVREAGFSAHPVYEPLPAKKQR